jgi:hypothetical protein
MKIQLDKKESEDYFYNAMCNGLNYMGGYGLSLDYNSDKYKKAKETLLKAKPDSTVCFEDILMQLLREGGKMTLVDMDHGDYTKSISIKDVHEKVQESPTRHLMDMVNQQDDAITAEVIIQTVFFGEVIFG